MLHHPLLAPQALAFAQRDASTQERGDQTPMDPRTAGEVIWLDAEDGGTGGHRAAAILCATKLRAPLCKRSQLCPGAVDTKKLPGKGPAGAINGGALGGEAWVPVVDGNDGNGFVQAGDAQWPT